jgi:NAD+ diphosphatase
MREIDDRQRRHVFQHSAAMMKSFKELKIEHFLYPAGKPSPDKEGVIFLFTRNRELLVHLDATDHFVPLCSSIGIPATEQLFFGELPEFNCFTAYADDVPPGNTLRHLQIRDALALSGQELYTLLARAHKLCHWNHRNRFCGACGTPTQILDTETARKCANCGEIYYPVIAPAVITAITRGEQILLAANRSFRPGLYSIIAGFVEAGESLEDAVQREIREEVGIKVKNIRYFDSQSWPFPNSLMIGFTAEYAAGEIIPDGTEIIDAQWFSPDQLPELPSNVSISRRIIDAVIQNLRTSGN